MIKTSIPRPYYLKKITPFINKDVIKIIVGQRRTGKSYLLYQIMDVLKRQGVADADIIYINKELYQFDLIKDHHDLLKFVKDHVAKSKRGKKKYLFIDEVQEITGFEKALRSLLAAGGFDIYCTGSNASLLSKEIAVFLGGRYVEVEVYGLSYLEFLKFHRLQDSKEALQKYMKYGGLPYLAHLELNDEVVSNYLRNIYDSILLKDVVSRFNVRNVPFLEKLVEFLADNVGSVVSANRISDFLKSQRLKISPNAILNYIDFLASAFLIFKAPRAEIVGKKIFATNDKFYFGDLGMRNAIVGYRPADISKIIENLVYLHLKIFGYQVTVGKLHEKEIDFVASRQGKKLYIQTAYLITNDVTREREFGNLLAIKDNYPKIVVSLDEVAGGEYQGILHLNLRDFLGKSW